MAPPPRVAFFTDSFHELNGVAHTSRHFVAYAQRHGLPFLSIRSGTARTKREDALHTLELPRSRARIPVEKDLFFDPLFPRHLPAVSRALRDFRPDVIHITGPSEIGILGAWFAWRHRLPLAASWHTNVHEYAGRRLHWLHRFLPARLSTRLQGVAEQGVLAATARFYRLARVLFAPNPELCRLLEQRCHRPVHLMQRGVDTHLFAPAHRTRPRHTVLSTEAQRSGETPVSPPARPSLSTHQPAHNPALATLRALPPNTLVLGFVGRLSVEKNVALLPHIQLDLRARGITNTRFLIVGHGNLEAALRRDLPDALFPGPLHGADLSEAFANMDLFVFPSHTDTFGNVVLEALASGVPALVTPSGGPRHIVHDPAVSNAPSPANQTGYILPDDAFAPTLATLATHHGTPASPLPTLAAAARAHALTCSWDSVFDRVYAAYATALPHNDAPGPSLFS